MNENWARWIFASVSKHFDSKKGTVHFFIEGQERFTAGLGEYMEFRMDGPYIKELSRNYFQLDIEVNILCAVEREGSDNHRIHRVCGVAVSGFTGQINVFKYGDTVNDNQQLLGCLIRKDEGREAVVVSHFGQIGENINMMQSTVEGHYRMHLEV